MWTGLRVTQEGTLLLRVRSKDEVYRPVAEDIPACEVVAVGFDGYLYWYMNPEHAWLMPVVEGWQ